MLAECKVSFYSTPCLICLPVKVKSTLKPKSFKLYKPLSSSFINLSFKDFFALVRTMFSNFLVTFFFRSYSLSFLKFMFLSFNKGNLIGKTT